MTKRMEKPPQPEASMTRTWRVLGSMGPCFQMEV